jgi:mRNA interferase RelE/StbE
LYKIVLLPDAQKFYKKLFYTDKEIFKRIDNALEFLKSDPYLGKALKAKLKNKYSLRVGIYRIIYTIVKHEVTIYVFDIGHRKDIYR